MSNFLLDCFHWISNAPEMRSLTPPRPLKGRSRLAFWYSGTRSDPVDEMPDESARIWRDERASCRVLYLLPHHPSIQSIKRASAARLIHLFHSFSRRSHIYCLSKRDVLAIQIVISFLIYWIRGFRVWLILDIGLLAYAINAKGIK